MCAFNRLALLWSVATAMPCLAGTESKWLQQRWGVGELLDVACVDHARIWVCMSDGSILRTQNGGRSWQSCELPRIEDGSLRSIDVVKDENGRLAGWAVSRTGGILASSDGVRWRQVDSRANGPVDPSAVATFDANRCAVIAPNGVYQTTDAGTSWEHERFPVGFDGDLVGLFGLRAGTLLIMTRGGRHSRYGGISCWTLSFDSREWQRQPVPDDGTPIVMSGKGVAIAGEGDVRWSVGLDGTDMARVRALTTALASEARVRQCWIDGQFAVILADSTSDPTPRLMAHTPEGNVELLSSWEPTSLAWSDPEYGCLFGSGGHLAITIDGGKTTVITRDQRGATFPAAYVDGLGAIHALCVDGQDWSDRRVERDAESATSKGGRLRLDESVVGAVCASSGDVFIALSTPTQGRVLRRGALGEWQECVSGAGVHDLRAFKGGVIVATDEGARFLSNGRNVAVGPSVRCVSAVAKGDALLIVYEESRGRFRAARVQDQFAVAHDTDLPLTGLKGQVFWPEDDVLVSVARSADDTTTTPISGDGHSWVIEFPDAGARPPWRGMAKWEPGLGVAWTLQGSSQGSSELWGLTPGAVYVRKQP